MMQIVEALEKQSIKKLKKWIKEETNPITIKIFKTLISHKKGKINLREMLKPIEEKKEPEKYSIEIIDENIAPFSPWHRKDHILTPEEMPKGSYGHGCFEVEGEVMRKPQMTRPYVYKSPIVSRIDSQDEDTKNDTNTRSMD